MAMGGKKEGVDLICSKKALLHYWEKAVSWKTLMWWNRSPAELVEFTAQDSLVQGEVSL